MSCFLYKIVDFNVVDIVFQTFYEGAPFNRIFLGIMSDSIDEIKISYSICLDKYIFYIEYILSFVTQLALTTKFCEKWRTKVF